MYIKQYLHKHDAVCFESFGHFQSERLSLLPGMQWRLQEICCRRCHSRMVMSALAQLSQPCADLSVCQSMQK